MGPRPIETTLVPLGRLAGVPATPGFRDLALLGEAGHDAVEVVLLDPHRVSELGNGDPGARLDEVERLVGAGAAAARAAAATAARALRAAGARTARSGRGRGGVAVRADAGQSLLGCLHPVVFLDERTQLLETLRDLLALFLKEVGHSATLL